MWNPFRKVRLASDPEVYDFLRRLDRETKQLREDLAALEGKHERLRGRFYATKPAEQPAQTGKPTLMELGFRPGQPFPHK